MEERTDAVRAEVSGTVLLILGHDDGVGEDA